MGAMVGMRALEITRRITVLASEQAGIVHADITADHAAAEHPLPGVLGRADMQAEN